MNTIESALKSMAQTLRDLNVDFALVGGLAVSARTAPRFTRDVDFAISVRSDKDAEQILSKLLAQGHRVLAQVEQDAVGRLSTARLALPNRNSNDIVVDLIFAACGIEPEIVRDAEIIEILPGCSIPVALTPHLLAMKILSVDGNRHTDRADIEALLQTPESPTQHALTVAQTKKWLECITLRGYHRNKDLVQDFRTFYR